MASMVRIEANRLNARKSTGPKTIDGKRSSSGNALRHGLTAALTEEEIEAAYLFVTGEKLPTDASTLDARVVRLARAQAQLSKAQSFERRVSFSADGQELTPREIEMIKEDLADNHQRDMLLLRCAAAVFGIKMGRGPKFGQMTQQLKGRVRRFLRQAEREYDRSLGEWLRS